MPKQVLKWEEWKRLALRYPDQRTVDTILGICEYGVRIGYEGSRTSPTIHPNLSSAEGDPSLVRAEITTELERNRLELYPDIRSVQNHYTASPLGLTDKSDGSKRRIHHLSYPAGDPSAINHGIPERYGAITYSGIEDAIRAIQLFGPGCILIKRDFEAAFRHTPVSPLDTPLLGFQWQKRFYAERFLPFGLQTAPYLFNLFAEVFHWILEAELSERGLEAIVIHYLDDFLVILPSTAILEVYTESFSELCCAVGLAIKTAKNEEGVLACFAGFELDTQTMTIRLPQKKLTKARHLVRNAIELNSLSLVDIQRITGYLNFLTTVVPLGRTFLRRLYNMEVHFPPGGKICKRRLSREAKKDLSWWRQILENTPERSIALRVREVVEAWSDAASSEGLGGFFIEPTQNTPRPHSAFSIPLPDYILKAREHINTLEMRAVEQVLLYWSREWKGKRLVIHVDNQAVTYGLANGTICGAPMRILRRCLLLATEYDLDIDARWVSTTENALADALSRADYLKIANIAPQLISPTSNLQRRGLLTYRGQDCQQ